MNINSSHPKSVRTTDKLRWRMLALAGTLCVLPLQAVAALTDIAPIPLSSGSTIEVKPNILFTLDDSGSMNSDYMPDEIDNETGKTGFKNHLCNTIYYNPAINYVSPKNADGTNFTAATFTSARSNGFDGTSTASNLDTSFKAHSGDTAQRAYYYVWSGGTAPLIAIGSTTATTGCWPSSSSAFPHTTGNWTKVQVTATSGPGSTDERVNFANWYSFYRTRLMLMKSAAGRAFVGISAGYRVGFITINPNSPVTSSKYLSIADFDVTQKGNWFTKLYSQTTNGSTPLREALSRAGRHFAGIQSGINNGMTGDPMQYSCQQNFTILTTDGYWNGNGGQQVDNSAIANHDGSITATPRPLYDGTTATSSSSRLKNEESYSTSGCSSGKKKIRLTTTTLVTPVTPTPGPEAVSGSPSTNTIVNCTNNGSIRALQSPNPQYTTPTIINSTTGGSSGSLADVAAYYYNTDLRGPGSLGTLGLDVGTDNNVPSAGSGVEDDSARHQHMTTFTMGLGLAGTLNYQSDYKTTGSGDFAALRSGGINWPAPSQNDPTALDDLWHTAVNGKGQFFSAANPDAVVTSLSNALAGVNARVASAAAAATSNLRPVNGDNFAYTASYKTLEWIGELEGKLIDLQTGAVSTTASWTAQAKLNAKTNQDCDTRVIKLFRSTATLTDKLVNFTWNTFACNGSGVQTGVASNGLDAAERAYFGATQVGDFSHFPDMTDGITPPLSVDQRTAAQGANLVNFLRGQRSLEGFVANDLSALYRTRTGVLGDIVNARPVFARAPELDYQDIGYADFKTANTNRTPIVYVGANDGMLHAFYAGTSATDPLAGEERWAFIPTMVLPYLYKLADKNYAGLHRYYVDASPTVADIFDPAASPTAPNFGWKTILVGGLNAGGRGYYALDVTDPANPKGLWEFTHSTTCAGTPAGQLSDCNLGLTYGNPVVSKLADGRWVVFVTSGYNNVNTPTPLTGDGQGWLYVLDALTGQIIYKIGTGAGDATTPSGLSKINAFALDTIVNNTTTHLYGGDMLGNVWRFEVNATQSATKLITLVDDTTPTPVPQPITTLPLFAEFGSPPTAYVFVGTGRYLGTTDLASTQKQTVWGIKDTGTYPIATPRTSMSKLQITDDVNLNRTISCLTNCTTNAGWYADLPISAERVNIDMQLQLGTLTVATNVPVSSACNIGGFSLINSFDARNGLQVAGSASFGSKLSDSLAVGINVVQLPDGRTVVIATTSDATQITAEAPIPPGDPQGRRTSWRELVQ